MKSNLSAGIKVIKLFSKCVKKKVKYGNDGYGGAGVGALV